MLVPVVLIPVVGGTAQASISADVPNLASCCLEVFIPPKV
jgi:hypothetical protein